MSKQQTERGVTAFLQALDLVLNKSRQNSQLLQLATSAAPSKWGLLWRGAAALITNLPSLISLSWSGGIPLMQQLQDPIFLVDLLQDKRVFAYIDDRQDDILRLIDEFYNTASFHQAFPGNTMNKEQFKMLIANGLELARNLGQGEELDAVLSTAKGYLNWQDRLVQYQVGGADKVAQAPALLKLVRDLTKTGEASSIIKHGQALTKLRVMLESAKANSNNTSSDIIAELVTAQMLDFLEEFPLSHLLRALLKQYQEDPYQDIQFGWYFLDALQPYLKHSQQLLQIAEILDNPQQDPVEALDAIIPHLTDGAAKIMHQGDWSLTIFPILRTPEIYQCLGSNKQIVANMMNLLQHKIAQSYGGAPSAQTSNIALTLLTLLEQMSQSDASQMQKIINALADPQAGVALPILLQDGDVMQLLVKYQDSFASLFSQIGMVEPEVITSLLMNFEANYRSMRMTSSEAEKIIELFAPPLADLDIPLVNNINALLLSIVSQKSFEPISAQEEIAIANKIVVLLNTPPLDDRVEVAAFKSSVEAALEPMHSEFAHCATSVSQLVASGNTEESSAAIRAIFKNWLKYQIYPNDQAYKFGLDESEPPALAVLRDLLKQGEAADAIREHRVISGIRRVLSYESISGDDAQNVVTIFKTFMPSVTPAGLEEIAQILQQAQEADLPEELAKSLAKKILSLTDKPEVMAAIKMPDDFPELFVSTILDQKRRLLAQKEDYITLVQRLSPEEQTNLINRLFMDIGYNACPGVLKPLEELMLKYQIGQIPYDQYGQCLVDLITIIQSDEVAESLAENRPIIDLDVLLRGYSKLPADDLQSKQEVIKSIKIKADELQEQLQPGATFASILDILGNEDIYQLIATNQAAASHLVGALQPILATYIPQLAAYGIDSVKLEQLSTLLSRVILRCPHHLKLIREIINQDPNQLYAYYERLNKILKLVTQDDVLAELRGGDGADLELIADLVVKFMADEKNQPADPFLKGLYQLLQPPFAMKEALVLLLQEGNGAQISKILQLYTEGKYVTLAAELLPILQVHAQEETNPVKAPMISAVLTGFVQNFYLLKPLLQAYSIDPAILELLIPSIIDKAINNGNNQEFLEGLVALDGSIQAMIKTMDPNFAGDKLAWLNSTVASSLTILKTIFHDEVWGGATRRQVAKSLYQTINISCELEKLLEKAELDVADIKNKPQEFGQFLIEHYKTDPKLKESLLRQVIFPSIDFTARNNAYKLASILTVALREVGPLAELLEENEVPTSPKQLAEHIKVHPDKMRELLLSLGDDPQAKLIRNKCLFLDYQDQNLSSDEIIDRYLQDPNYITDNHKSIKAALQTTFAAQHPLRSLLKAWDFDEGKIATVLSIGFSFIGPLAEKSAEVTQLLATIQTYQELRMQSPLTAAQKREIKAMEVHIKENLAPILQHVIVPFLVNNKEALKNVIGRLGVGTLINKIITEAADPQILVNLAMDYLKSQQGGFLTKTRMVFNIAHAILPRVTPGDGLAEIAGTLARAFKASAPAGKIGYTAEVVLTADNIDRCFFKDRTIGCSFAGLKIREHDFTNCLFEKGVSFKGATIDLDSLSTMCDSLIAQSPKTVNADTFQDAKIILSKPVKLEDIKFLKKLSLFGFASKIKGDITLRGEITPTKLLKLRGRFPGTPIVVQDAIITNSAIFGNDVLQIQEGEKFDRVTIRQNKVQNLYKNVVLTNVTFDQCKFGKKVSFEGVKFDCATLNSLLDAVEADNRKNKKATVLNLNNIEIVNATEGEKGLLQARLEALGMAKPVATLGPVVITAQNLLIAPPPSPKGKNKLLARVRVQ
jgi:hypothetical protein